MYELNVMRIDLINMVACVYLPHRSVGDYLSHQARSSSTVVAISTRRHDLWPHLSSVGVYP